MVAESAARAGRSTWTSNARGHLRGTSFAQPTMNSSASASRSFSRKGEGSISLNSCLSSATWTSITSQPGGIGSPAGSCSGTRPLQQSDLSEEADLIVEELLLDDLAVLPARHR